MLSNKIINNNAKVDDIEEPMDISPTKSSEKSTSKIQSKNFDVNSRNFNLSNVLKVSNISATEVYQNFTRKLDPIIKFDENKFVNVESLPSYENENK